MQLMTKRQGIADINKISHDVGKVFEVLMLGFKVSGPMID